MSLTEIPGLTRIFQSGPWKKILVTPSTRQKDDPNDVTLFRLDFNDHR